MRLSDALRGLIVVADSQPTTRPVGGGGGTFLTKETSQNCRQGHLFLDFVVLGNHLGKSLDLACLGPAICEMGRDLQAYIPPPRFAEETVNHENADMQGDRGGAPWLWLESSKAGVPVLMP